MSHHRHEPSRDDVPRSQGSRMPAGARRLMPGDLVTYDLVEGDDGPPYALNVRLIEAADASSRPGEA